MGAVSEMSPQPPAPLLSRTLRHAEHHANSYYDAASLNGVEDALAHDGPALQERLATCKRY